MKDPGIKLFGKKIELPETTKVTNLPAYSTAGEESRGGDGGGDHGSVMEEKNCSEEERVNRHAHTLFTPHGSREKYGFEFLEVEDQGKGEAKPEDESDDTPKTPSIDEDTMQEKPPTTGTEGNTENLQPKTPKKPNKILPCPRCDSMDTKFCYYNNCNVNQPRHFCKSCQRYWTAGGTMRNMPVGAGRRKKKNSAAHCRFVTISQEAFHSAAAPQIEFAADSDGVHNSVPPPKVLSFGPNSPHFGANISLGSCRGRENGDDCSSGSTGTTTNSVAEKMQDNNGFHSQCHWIPGASWSYNPWNSAIPIPIPIPIPAICPPGYPQMPIYPSPYWSSVSWLPPATSAPNFSILAKHSRDGEAIKSNGSEEEPKKQKNSVLIPKTLRIDDPDEAAKSSIWATLGIKNENISRGSLFKAFQAKGDEKKKHPAMTSSPVLQANPAALSRSLCFQERA